VKPMNIFKQRHLLCLLTVVVLIFPMQVMSNEATSNKLKLGVFPRRNPIVTTRMFTPLVQYLSEKLRVQVVLDTPKDFQSFYDNVKHGEYDLVHYNQYDYLKSHKEFGYQVIAKNIEFNESTIAGAIIVRKDSNINSVLDLKGKKIIFGGGKQAMQSYIVAKYLLLSGGLKPDDFEEVFSTNPPNAILAAYYKQADAAGAGDKVLQLKIVKNQIDINEMKYLVRGEQLAHLPWAVKPSLGKAMVKRIKSLLLDLAKTGHGKAILKRMHLNGFANATDKDYDPHRKIINLVMHEQF
jgi:phosphonate transport system substrate-binding protein